MDNLFFPFDLSDFPTVDKEKRRDEIIEATKALNKMIKDSRNQAKQSNCYYCGNDCDSFCNSHTLPAFCLRNIAQNGKVFALSGKTPELLTLTPPSPERILEAAKEIFDFRDRQNIPNLLSSQFALNNE